MERHQADAPEQTTRRPPRKRPACPQWYLLGLAVGRTVARSAGNLPSSDRGLRFFAFISHSLPINAEGGMFGKSSYITQPFVMPELCNDKEIITPDRFG